MPVTEAPVVAAITPKGDGGTDDLISSVAISLMNRGWRVRGLTQERFRKDEHCQYSLVDLETGLAHSISQNLGFHSDACRLNLQSMADASMVLKRIADEGADIAIVNRFGKEEASGRGFATEILNIMSRGIPLITIVQDEQLSAWREFTGGMAVELPNKFEHVMSWVRYKVRPVQSVLDATEQAKGSGSDASFPWGAALAHGCSLPAQRVRLSQSIPVPVDIVPERTKQTLRNGALSSVRHSRHLMQQELAERMDTSQAQIAQIEGKSDMLLSTLRRYVNGLGGELDLVARFPSVSYHLGRDGN